MIKFGGHRTCGGFVLVGGGFEFLIGGESERCVALNFFIFLPYDSSCSSRTECVVYHSDPLSILAGI